MGFKPFYYRLPMRLRVWNLRREQKDKHAFDHFVLLKYKRRHKKPAVLKRALRRARRMQWWGKLFDPDLPF